MTLVLYDNGASSNAMKVRFLLAELGLEYERRHVPLSRPRPGWYLERYPFGTIPFMEDGDLAFGESNAMLRYLANREGRLDLYPEEPRERARVDWALDAWSTQFRGAFFPAERIGLMHVDLDSGGGRAEDADQGRLAEAIEVVKPKLDLMERFVADNGTVLGTFTIADCAFAPVLWRWYRLPLALDPWPKVALLRDTVTARPAFAAMEPLA
ncbi:MAG TPA: glutathione S-transferase family protein [Gaiellales bacterium]|jgi:glutathione S-transferase|nr:glutathione S-transferase family protein [Gaiellales bacterium]